MTIRSKNIMVKLATAKYIRAAPIVKPSKKEGGLPYPILASDGTFGNEGFTMYWDVVKAPTVMHPGKPHKHTFNQYLIFLGGLDNLQDLGSDVEMTLSEDGKTLDKHIFNKATQIYVPAGLWHCPLKFTKVAKPILFIDIYFAKQYKATSKK
jgi:hypothetical protein